MNQRIIFTEAEVRLLDSPYQAEAYRLSSKGYSVGDMVDIFRDRYPEVYLKMDRRSAIQNISRHLNNARGNLVEIHNKLYTSSN